MPLRYARWAAVSTDDQARPDKDSIPIQLEKAQTLAHSKGWIETAGPFIAAGDSRTRFVSLRDAEDHISELKQLLNAAARHEYDLLIVYDLNRFRSLMRQIFDVLCDYNVQLYILNNPREPVPPALYDEDVRAAVGMIVDMSGIISHNEINAIRRHYREKMPARVTVHGLHAGTGHLPYGYKKSEQYNSKSILIPDPLTAPVVIDLKNRYLAGASYAQLAREMNQTDIPSPFRKKWSANAINIILVNKFYAGIVEWGKTKSTRDRRTGKTVRVQSIPQKNTGLHTPLWDLQTHMAITEQTKLRGQTHSGKRTQQLSSLMRCPCGKLMHLSYSPYYKSRGNNYWMCSSKQPRHLTLINSVIYPLIVNKIIDSLRHVENIKLPEIEDKRPILTKQKRELETRKNRWMDAFETGEINARDYSQRVASITSQIETVQLQLSALENTITKNQNRRQQLNTITSSLEVFQDFLYNAPPHQVNAQLLTLIEYIDITKDLQITINWRP